MSTHLYPEVAAHVMRVTETAHWLEWQDWADPILQKPYEIRDGFLHIPDLPGVGLEWNEEAARPTRPISKLIASEKKRYHHRTRRAPRW